MHRTSLRILGLLVVVGILVASHAAGGSVYASTSPAREVVQPVQDGYMLIPLPRQVAWLGNDFLLPPTVSIVVADSAEEADLYAARDLQLELARIGIESAVLRASDVTDPHGSIVLGEIGSNPWVAELTAKLGVLDDEELPPEGYRLHVTPEYVLVAGADRRGTYWGAQTLRQLIAPTPRCEVVRGVEITDWPDYPIRALHMFAGSEPGELQQQMIRDVMARFKLNTLILQVDQAKWESHPEIWAVQAPSKATLRALADTAEQHMIEVIPQITTFGHMGWAFRNGQNTHIAADKSRPYEYDPLNPASYEFAKEIYDEAIELFRPRYVHIGHDEVRFYGPIPTGGKPFGQVFVDSVRYWHDYFAEQGIGTMMWGDEARSADVRPFLDQLPKDIVMVYWNYDMFNPEVPPMNILTDKGFPVIGGVWHGVESTQKMVETGLELGAIGMTGTTWAGFFPDRQTLYSDSLQYAVYIVDAELFWNARGRDVDSLPYDPADVLRASLTADRRRSSTDGFTVDLRDLVNVNAANWLATSTVQRKIDGVNTGRGVGQLIVYTPERGRTTGTNVWGTEATVVDGYVTSVGGNNSPIPANGFVISNQEWVGEHAIVGAQVTIEGDLLTITKGERTELYRGIASLPKGMQRLGGVLFDLIDGDFDAVAVRSGATEVPRQVQIPIGGKADALWFLHTTTEPLNPMQPVGMYQIEYQDGTRASQPLIYGVNITAWTDSSHPNLLNPLAWADGGGRLNAMRWQNPNPDKEIKSVRLTSQHAGTSTVLLGLTGERAEADQ